MNVLERTQFLVPFSRIGGYEPAALRALSGPGGPWFEYWGHAASLLPTEMYPLFGWKMEQWRHDLVDSPAVQERRRAWRMENAGYITATLHEVGQRGPLTAGQLSDPRRREGDWWARRSDGRHALELLFGEGALAAWRNAGFERVYDLTERVIAPEILARPTPPAEEAQRELICAAARCMGVGSAGDLADYFWIRPGPGRERVAELVEEGRLVEVAVEGWRQPGYVLPGTPGTPGARLRAPRRRHGTLLSPFDSLIWKRDRTERLFGFHYRIGIYVPSHLRTHGYYVMPLLLEGELVARFDLKADRKTRTLRVAASYLEPEARRGPVVEAAAAELEALREWLGLATTAVSARGDLASALRKALRLPLSRSRGGGRGPRSRPSG